MVSACFIVSATWGLSAYGQQSPQYNTASVDVGHKQESQTDKIGMNDENVAHPFFKGSGVPDTAGGFHPRPDRLATHTESHTDGNFTSRCGTELTKFIDPHVINDRFPANPPTGAIFQFKDVTNKDGMSGFLARIESKTSTQSGNTKRLNTPASHSTVPLNSRALFNQSTMTTRENTEWTAGQGWGSPSRACSSD
jgi:hypothetical protein